MDEISKEYVLNLIQKKDAIEAEIEGMRLILQSQNNVGMQEPLVDTEGYPRSDIDVYKVRHTRHNLICLQNDHKDLMKTIEKSLHELHEQERNKSDNLPLREQSPSPTASQLMLKIFAKVDLLTPGSPAEEAGLKVGDLIYEFGSITKKNFSSMQDIGVLVQHSVGRSIGIDVIRDKKPMHLSLVPKPWKEKGLLGCRIVPFTSSSENYTSS